MEDHVFGHLRYDRSLKAWQGASELRLTDEQTVLAIHSDGPTPTQNQRNTYTDLETNFDSYRSTIEREAFRYQRKYTRWIQLFILPIYSVIHRLTTGEAISEEVLLTATQPRDVWRLLAVPAIEIPVDNNDARTVAFLFECEWNPNDGFIIVMTNGKMAFVGSQAER